MLTKELAEQLATILSNLQCLPTMHNSILFTTDIAEFMGFQVQCNLNKNGRLVYGIIDTDKFPNAHKNFCGKYKECYDYEVRTTPASEKQIYPTTGSDSINDIAPGTITRLLRIESEFNQEETSSIPVFIMHLGEQAEKWEIHFKKMAENLGTLKNISEQIYENVLLNTDD